MNSSANDSDSAVSDSSVSDLERLIHAASDRYAQAAAQKSSGEELQQYLSLIDGYPRELPYDYVSTEVATRALLVQHRHGATGLYEFHACVLIALIRRNFQTLLESEHPQDIKTLGIENFCRILSILIDGENDAEHPADHRPPTYLHYHSDRFYKDLSAASLRLLVYGGRKVCRVSFPRGLIKTHPLQMARYIALNGVGGAYLETHFDSNDLNLRARFGERSWRQVLCNVGRMMRLDPSIKGFTGHSWYYDPCLLGIAPGLAHIGELIVDNGGNRFCTGASEDTTESALRGSTVRRGLYELGLYQPKRFKIVWPRKAALRWLDSKHST